MKYKATIGAALLMALVCPLANAQTPSHLLRLLMAQARFVPAVEFDGKTTLTYRGSLFGIPDAGSAFYANYFFSKKDIPTEVQENIIVAHGDANTTGEYVASLTITQALGGYIPIFFGGCQDHKSWFIGYGSQRIPLNGGDHVLTVDVDNSAQQPKIRFKLDDVEDPHVIVSRTGQRCNFNWSNVTSWDIGGDANNGDFRYKGVLAELYMDLSGRLTADDSWRFITDTAEGPRANGLQLDCIKPLGDIPTLCLRGGPGYFVLGPSSMSGFFAYGFGLNNGGTLHTAKSAPCLVRRFGNGCSPTGVPGDDY